MNKIIGIPVGTPLNPDALKRKLNPVTSVNNVLPDENGNVEVDVNETLVVSLRSENSKATKTSTQIADAVANKQHVILKRSDGEIYNLDGIYESASGASAVFAKTFVYDGEVVYEAYDIDSVGRCISTREIVESSGANVPSGGTNGIPPGGKAGQFLCKASDEDYDVKWADFEIPKEYGLITYDQDKTITIT